MASYYVSAAHCLWLITMHNDHPSLRLPTFQISPWLSKLKISCLLFFLHGARGPRQPRPPHYQGFTITLSRTPLDEWSAKCRDHYLVTCNTHRTHIRAQVGFKPAIPASKQLHTHALERTATGIGPPTWLLVQILWCLLITHDYFRLPYWLMSLPLLLCSFITYSHSSMTLLTNMPPTSVAGSTTN
jgi:hypothetical protein